MRPEATRADLEDQVHAMAAYAMRNGLALPLSAVEVLHATEHADPDGAPDRSPAVEFGKLTVAHQALARTVAPAMPHSLALLAHRRRDGSPRIVPIRLIRHMLAVASVSLVAFVGSAIWVDWSLAQQGSEPAFERVPALARFLYLVLAAGLGAAFYALFTATRYANRGTYDDRFETYYWVRFVLGLMGGTLLAILLRDWAPLDRAQLTAPILALIGGFAADIVHRVLRRIVETIDALLRGQDNEEPAPAPPAPSEREQLILQLAELERTLRADGEELAADAVHARTLTMLGGTFDGHGPSPTRNEPE